MTEQGSLRFTLAALAAGLFAAFAVPIGGPGVGIILIALAMLVAIRLAEIKLPPITDLVLGGIGLALLGLIAIRAAEWVAVFNLLAAGGLASLALARASSVRSVMRDLFSVLFRLHRAPGLLFRPLANRVQVLGRAAPALRGVIWGSILVLIFGVLFFSADRAFAHLTTELFQIVQIDWGMLPFRTFVFVAVAAFTAAYVLGAFRAPDVSASNKSVRTRFAPTEWTIALGLVILLFLAFVVVQFTDLFGGGTYVLRTAGLIYSEYARQGFFQLMFAATLTLALVAVAVRWAGRSGAGERRRLQILLAALCVLTLVILASALKRLLLYEEAFGFTRARLTAHGLIFWLAGMFLMVLIAGAIWRGDWLPKTMVGFAAASLLVFGAVNPDRLIASHNVARYELTGKIDDDYLSGLSPDAVPALAELPRSLRGCVLEDIAHLLKEGDSWAEFNLSRERARKILKEAGSLTCSEVRAV